MRYRSGIALRTSVAVFRPSVKGVAQGERQVLLLPYSRLMGRALFSRHKHALGGAGPRGG